MAYSLRYRLRTLVTLFAVLSLVLAVIGRWVAKAERQRFAVGVLQEKGVGVLYDYAEYEEGDGYFGYRSVPKPPQWISALGPNLFHDVMCIGHDDESALANEDLALVARFPRLRSAILSGPGITDDGLPHLQQLAELDNLTLYDTSVTPGGVARLQQFLRQRIMIA